MSISDSVQFLSNYPWHFFIELEQKNFFKICIETHHTTNSENNPEGKNPLGSFVS